MSAALSYVVVTDAPGTIRRVLECLRGQTARRAVEVVIVTTTGAEAAIRAGTPDEFAAVRVVALPSIWPMAVARAAGVRAARAEVVFIGETHSFPQPGFAAAVIEAAARPWDVLVPGLDNANPGTAISWSNFLLDYGSWHPVLPGGAIPGGPTWNVAYRRAVLRAVDGSLERMFGHGDDLAVAFHAAGRLTEFVPAARIDHANVSRARWWFEQRYLAGLLVGESRRQRWPASRRVLYLLASPLIVPVILARLRHAIGAARRSGMPWTALPALVAGATFRTVGEAVAYARGAAPGAQDRMDEYELHKLDFTELAS